jgi:hypothetical protein
MTESNIMRALWMLLGLCLIPAMSRGDVVVYDQNASTTAYFLDTAAEKYGQAFTNSAGNVAVSRVQFFLSKTGTVTGNLVVKIYASTGGASAYTPTGAALVNSGTLDASTITASEVGYTFTGFALSTNLTSGNTYFAVLDTSGLTSTLDNSNKIGVWTNGPFNPTPPPLNGASQQGSSAWVAEAYEIRGSVVMVPEPGTLLLGGIAAACGGGGAWWRRRRRQAKEVAVADPAA